MSDFLVNLEQHQKALLLIGCLPLPFDSATITMITRFVASAVGKIYKLRLKNCTSWRLHGLPNNLVKFTAFFFRFKLSFREGVGWTPYYLKSRCSHELETL